MLDMRKKLHLFFSLICLLVTFGVAASAHALSPSELKTGDVLLQPLNCYLCNAIEKLEGSIYSHSAIVIRNSNGEILLLESLGNVHTVSLSDFASRNQVGQFIRVVRPRDFAGISGNSALRTRMLDLFYSKFDGLLFDNGMRWDNFDSSGNELLYCSEFVAKFLSNFLSHSYATKTMHFSVLREFWIQFFHGDVPEGEQGIAPSDFLSPDLSIDLGDLSI